MKLQLNWHQSAKIVGTIGEMALADWVSKNKQLKGYALLRNRINQDSFRHSILNQFSRFDLNREQLYRQRFTASSLMALEQCAICQKVFKGGKAYSDFERHLYKTHPDICRGYDYVKDFFTHVLYNKRLDNVLIKKGEAKLHYPRSSYAALQEMHMKAKKIVSVDDFKKILTSFLSKTLPIVVEVKAAFSASEKRRVSRLLSPIQQETRKAVLGIGWGYLLLSVAIDEKNISIEDIEFHMPDRKKMRQSVVTHFKVVSKELGR